MQLKLERKSQPNATVVIGAASISPLVDEDYWEYRVIVGEHQAVVGFPKYTTIGIGFAVEENWKGLPLRRIGIPTFPIPSRPNGFGTTSRTTRAKRTSPTSGASRPFA